jgi:transmembrane sensor
MSMAEKDIAVPSAGACAQAAAWIARLHGEARTHTVEAGFRRWLAADPAHRAAFEMANDLWDGAERWPRPGVSAGARRRAPLAMAWTLPRAAAAAGIAAAVLMGGALYLNASPRIDTAVGEQRNLTLEDGTRVSLNTATRIRLQFDKGVRRVRLESGEAMFEVARRPDWPFVVMAGDQQITALGTAFMVRRDEREVAVTLLEGKVAVEPVASRPQSPREVLTPGERLTWSEAAPPKRDRPALQKVTAWQRNQVMLDHTSLADAVREMNRYSTTPLVIEHPLAADVEVTGVFRAGDSASFAQAVAEAYGLQVIESPRQLVLSGVPVPPGR